MSLILDGSKYSKVTMSAADLSNPRQELLSLKYGSLLLRKVKHSPSNFTNPVGPKENREH